MPLRQGLRHADRETIEQSALALTAPLSAANIDDLRQFLTLCSFVALLGPGPFQIDQARKLEHKTVSSEVALL